MKKAIRFAIMAVVAVLLSLLAYAQQQPPAQIPLGDVVKQQKAPKKAKKIVTDDDMPARPPETAAASAGATVGEAAAAQPGKAVETANAAVAKTPEVERQAKIAALKVHEEKMKSIIQKMEESLADPAISDNRRQTYTDTLQLSREQLEKYAKEREALEQQGTAQKPPQSSDTEKQ